MNLPAHQFLESRCPGCRKLKAELELVTPKIYQSTLTLLLSIQEQKTQPAKLLKLQAALDALRK